MVTKRARVVEEVVVHKDVTEHTETVRGTVRHTDVDVQREPETATETKRGTAPQDFATYDPMFRKHYATAFADRGGAYTEYEPAYRYGYELRTNERYRRARSSRAPRLGIASTWDASDAIRYGWECRDVARTEWGGFQLSGSTHSWRQRLYYGYRWLRVGHKRALPGRDWVVWKPTPRLGIAPPQHLGAL